MYPFLDLGILRTGGRIGRSNLPYKSKHPILLPEKHKISKMLIQEAHIANLHAGTTLLAHILKQTFWIVGAKRLIRKLINKCVVCCRYRSKPVQQLMGDLPKARVEISRAFTNCGCDFTGAIEVKISKGRGQKTTKSYVALFVCLATKALHLELVGDLTSESFIAALRRFISRRGCPAHIYCDNATNFVGARRKIDEVQKFIKQISDDSKIVHFFNTKVIEWHFIPPASPHFGGIWEAGVKSVKFHIKRSIGDTRLTFEELSTLLCQIEAILNSRPLVSPDNDIESLYALTPSHFLIGEELSFLPDKPSSDELPPRTRWQMVQSIRNSFWKRWSGEYLHSLQQRTKWKKPELNLKIGDLVILKENLPPATWPLGRVMELHPGKDGLVRVATIKTSKGLFKRTVSKLILI